MEELVRSFEEWIVKQPHFTKKNFSKHFLEVSIIMSKGSLEKAKKNLDKLCTLRTLIPKFFSKHNIKKDMVDCRNIMEPLFLPRPTEDHYRVLLLKISSTDIDNNMWFDHYRTMMLMCEYMKAHDYTQGFCSIIDIRSLNALNFAMKLNVLELKDMFATVMEGYGMKIKSINFVTDSKAVDALISIMKQVLSEKIGKRVHVHKTLESVYDYVERDLLPEDYGGKDRPFAELYDDYLNLLSSEENVEYFKDICSSGTNETYRQTSIFNEDILGIPGSFRTLVVD